MTAGVIALTTALTLSVGSLGFLILWALAGIGSHRLRETAQRSKQGRGEVGGGVGVHGKGQ